MADLSIVATENDLDEDEKDVSGIEGWVMTRVKAWEDHRNTTYNERWNEYYRLWRGFWNAKDKSRKSERSRLITPALAQAVDATVAELEEATFGGGKWFDIDDNYSDPDKTDIAMFRDSMREDLDDAGVPQAVAEIFMNGCLYGTGIGKIVVQESERRKLTADYIDETEIANADSTLDVAVECTVVPVSPFDFVIDPTARTVDDALGCAHITEVTRHSVQAKIAAGIYDKDAELGGFTDTVVGGKSFDKLLMSENIRDQDKVMLVEYHGLVPREMLPIDLEEDEVAVELFDEDDEGSAVDEDDLVEAIVTIANGTELLRAIENPNIMKDRAFIAYPHERVPNQFWGRGVMEKGFNPQKALDAELRGRIDAMALAVHPMMGIDASRMTRGGNYGVSAGKNIFTNGNPSEILTPIQFGQVTQATFSQSGELERMVQMATGAMDSATPIGENRRNETSSGMSMIMSGSIKRTKRTLANIERMFTKPLIHKCAWRYMQYAPDRYPVTDVKWKVLATMGQVARELEQQNMANMMQTVPQESPAFWMLMKGMYENSDLSNREEMLPLIDQLMQDSLKKQQQPEEQDPLVAVKMQELKLEAQEMQTKAQLEQAKLQQKDGIEQKELMLKMEDIQLKKQTLVLKEKEIVLKARLELAAQEQDSNVTAIQMSVKAIEAQNKQRDKEAAAKPAAAPAAPAAPQIIQMAAPEKKTKKKLTIKRTDKGLEGTVEETADTDIQKINVVRTKDGLEGTSE